MEESGLKMSKSDTSKYKGQSILSEEFEEMSNIQYRPKTVETRQTYEIMLSFIQECIGDQVDLYFRLLFFLKIINKLVWESFKG